MGDEGEGDFDDKLGIIAYTVLARQIRKILFDIKLKREWGSRVGKKSSRATEITV